MDLNSGCLAKRCDLRQCAGTRGYVSFFLSRARSLARSRSPPPHTYSCSAAVSGNLRPLQWASIFCFNSSFKRLGLNLGFAVLQAFDPLELFSKSGLVLFIIRCKIAETLRAGRGEGIKTVAGEHAGNETRARAHPLPGPSCAGRFVSRHSSSAAPPGLVQQIQNEGIKKPQVAHVFCFAWFTNSWHLPCRPIRYAGCRTCCKWCP